MRLMPTPEESLAKMIASLPEKTGKGLEEWQLIIAASGLTKHTEIVAMLKTQHGLTHGFAHQIALRKTEAQPVAAGDDGIDAVFAKRPEARPLYEAVATEISTFGTVEFAPKKAYVSVRRKKQFAILQPGAGRLDIGINLPETPVTDRLEASGSFNAMLSHRVRLTTLDEVDAELIGWLRAAFDRA